MSKKVTNTELIRVIEVLLVNAFDEDSELVLSDSLLCYEQVNDYFFEAIEQLIFEFNVLDFVPKQSDRVFFKLSRLRKLHSSLTADIYGRGSVIIKLGKYLIDEDNGWFIYEDQEQAIPITIPVLSQPIRFLLLIAKAGGEIIEYKELARILDINGYNEELDNDYHAEIVKFNKSELKKLLIKVGLPTKVVDEVQHMIKPVRHSGYRLASL